MKTVKKIDKKIECFVLIIIAVIIIIHSAFFANSKSGYFLDETWTFVFSNVKATTFGNVIESIRSHDLRILEKDFQAVLDPSEEWIDSPAAQNRLMPQGKGMGSYLNVYIFQAGDVHPPLYYYIFHTVSYLFKTLSLKWVGFIVNIIFLVAASFVIFKILKLITKDSAIAAAGMLYYGLSFDFVNNATYYRMYAMLAFWVTLHLYLTLRWHQSGYQSDKYLKAICVGEVLALLTQYFAVFYFFPIFIINLILLKRHGVKAGKYIKYNIIAAVIYLIIWPFSIRHVLDTDMGIAVVDNIKKGVALDFLRENIKMLKASVFSNSIKYMIGFVCLSLVFFGVVVFIHAKKKELRQWRQSIEYEIGLYLMVPALFYFFIVSNSSPYITDRYEMPIMPIMCIIIVYVLSAVLHLLVKNRRYISGAVLLAFTIILCLHWHAKITPYYLYNSSESKAFIAEYTPYKAVIVDTDIYNFRYSIEMNFIHSQYYETKESDVKKVLERELDANDNLVLYVNRFGDTEALENIMSSIGISYKEIDITTDFYKVYFLSNTSGI